MKSLILYELKNKKGLLVLNFIIFLVITSICGFWWDSSTDIVLTYVGLATTAASIVVLIGTFIDCSFLHDERKITYYLSKPISLTKKINICFLTNMSLFMIMFFLTIGLSIMVSGVLDITINSSNFDYFSYDFFEDILYYNVVLFAWTLILQGLIVLSSLLSGNTWSSVVTTAFNFGLPVILYLCVATVLSYLANGLHYLDENILYELVLHDIVDLSKIYFLEHLSHDWLGYGFYVFRLIGMVTAIYLVSIYVCKKRKNENTGEAIIDYKYKCFVAFMLAFSFSSFLSVLNLPLISNTILFLFVIAVSYYIAISIFEKTFKISIVSVKIFAVAAIGILLIRYGLPGIINSSTNNLPDSSEVKGVMITDEITVLTNVEIGEFDRYRYSYKSISDIEFEDVIGSNSVILLDEKESIDLTIDYQRSLMDNYYVKESKDYIYDYYYNKKIYMTFFLENGEKIIRAGFIPRQISLYKTEEIALDINAKLIDIQETEEFFYEANQGILDNINNSTEDLSEYYDDLFIEYMYDIDVDNVDEELGDSRLANYTKFDMAKFDVEIFLNKYIEDLSNFSFDELTQVQKWDISTSRTLFSGYNPYEFMYNDYELRPEEAFYINGFERKDIDNGYLVVYPEMENSFEYLYSFVDESELEK